MEAAKFRRDGRDIARELRLADYAGDEGRHFRRRFENMEAAQLGEDLARIRFGLGTLPGRRRRTGKYSNAVRATDEKKEMPNRRTGVERWRILVEQDWSGRSLWLGGGVRRAPMKVRTPLAWVADWGDGDGCVAIVEQQLGTYRRKNFGEDFTARRSSN